MVKNLKKCMYSMFGCVVGCCNALNTVWVWKWFDKKFRNYGSGPVDEPLRNVRCGEVVGNNFFQVIGKRAFLESNWACVYRSFPIIYPKHPHIIHDLFFRAVFEYFRARVQNVCVHQMGVVRRLQFCSSSLKSLIIAFR